MLEDPNPQALLDFGSSLAIAEDASSIVVGAGGRVMLNAISGGSDTAVDGRVGPSQGCCGLLGSFIAVAGVNFGLQGFFEGSLKVGGFNRPHFVNC